MRKLFYLSFVLLLFSCNLKEERKTDEKLYFDLEGYFNKEAIRLTKKKASIDKTVVVNGKSEEKELAISDWKKEFESFTDADINKASWKKSFTVTKKDGLETNTSNSDKIPVKKLEIGFKNEKVISIKVVLMTKNYLYTSQDSLAYFPDSLYRIKKMQHIKLNDVKNYQVIGKFK